MTHTAFTPRNVAKYIAVAIVHGKTAQLTSDAITDRTQFEDDDMIVNISSHVVGWYVSHKLKPVTDKMVDVTADRIIAFRESRKSDTPETEK